MSLRADSPVGKQAAPAKRKKAAALAQAERESQAAVMRGRRAAGREIVIPECKNPRRRRKCGRDVEYCLKTYMPEIFYNPFTDYHRKMIDSLVERVHYGGNQAIAAPRGEGKSSIIEGVVGVWMIPYGIRNYPFIVGASRPSALSRLATIKAQWQFNDVLLEDFPEIAWPIRCLQGSPRRGHMQTIAGEFTRIRWGTDMVVFPYIMGSKASGAVIEVRGIESEIRGAKFEDGRRPDVVILDDIEHEESVKSEEQTKNRRNAIDKACAGLAGQNKTIAMFMPCTIIRKDCLADEYTDRQKKPAWMGLRYKLLVQKPDDPDKWETYMTMRQEDQMGGDAYARRAHAYYLADRDAMDAGAIVGNDHRYSLDMLADGTQMEVSTLQFCYNVVSDRGWSAFRSEYQQEPPEEEARSNATPDEKVVQSSTNGVARGTVPAGCEKLVGYIDVHGRHLDWLVCGWRMGVGHIVDYGATRVNSPDGSLTSPDNAEALELAIYDALCEWADWAGDNGWPDEKGGEVRLLDRCLVDTGYRNIPVNRFIRGHKPTFQATRGFGTGMGQAKYRQPTVKGKGPNRKEIGTHWFAAWQAHHQLWLYSLDADYWKLYAQQAFQAPTGKPGSLALFGEDPVVHRAYALQVTAEQYVTEYRTGKGRVSFWNKLARDNHWLDCTAGCCGAAAILKVVFTGEQPVPEKPPAKTPGRQYVSRFKRKA
ncbi:MAG TPA: terminase gpA endonuclease subunit [Phycisphaerae bacterium]|nr:terminase gpA endonuclease subunit [Phycisphaerae bacterium]